MTAPAPANTLPALAQRVSLLFASRPTFEEIAQRMLEQAIKEKYPSLTFDLSKTRLATPDPASRGFTLQPFMPRVLEYLALGTPVDFTERGGRRCFLSDAPPRELSPDDGKLDIKVIEKLLLELPWTVPIGLEDALTRYWNAGIDTSNNLSRWRWLSDALKNTLSIRRLRQPGLTDQAREALDQIVRWPEREQRFRRNNPSPVYAYSLETKLIRDGSNTVLTGSEILLDHSKKGVTLLLLCSPGGAVQSFASLEAFNHHWGALIASRYVVDTLTCQRNEISGNVFDTQAAMVLEQQLADLNAVQLPSRIGLQDLSTLYQELSDPARYLLDAPRLTPETSARIEPLLPDWLKKASIVDQTKFQHYSLTLASAKKRHQGRTFLSDIEDIKAFTADALLKQMRQTNDSHPDKAQPSQYQPDDIELTFSVAAGYPGTTGIIEKRTMSLTELAINNLIARPSANLILSHRLGLTLPRWLTPDFITRKNGLIEQVDIGSAYPRYLQQRLLDDVPQAQERQRMFAEQIPAQLTLEALQQMLNHENGVTRQGLGLVEALLNPDADSQQVSGQSVVIRHLAFLRKPEAHPDIVNNMFIIEPENVQTGPHLLYRPLYAPSLQEFPTREALLKAVVTPGDLQKSILTWMTDAARPIYANGGFQEPHIVRFFQGDEFNLPAKPAPATLAIDGANDELRQFLRNGELMQYLYGSNARALISQADRDSVSNSESRWALLLKGGSLLFNTLLMPLLRGPVMVTFWLWSLMASASQDIPALSSEDPVTRELAAVDLLLNLGMLVHQFPAISALSHAPLPDALKEQAMRPPAPRTFPEQWPAPASPRILEGPVGLPGEHLQGASRHLDLSFASARQRLTAEQRNRLQRLQVPRPTSMPEPIKYGPYTGLYVIQNKWHALVEDLLYRISPEPDGNTVIVDPQAPRDSAKNGPVLKSDTQGNWSMDLRLRLRGGMPPKRVAELRKLRAQRGMELSRELANYHAQEADKLKAVQVAQEVMSRTQEGAFTEEQRAAKRTQFYELLQDQTDDYLRLLNKATEYAGLDMTLPPEMLRALMENVVNNARKAFLVVELDLLALDAANIQFIKNGPALKEAVADNPAGYFAYLDAMSVINDRSIYWLELKDRHLDALLNLDAEGAQIFERLTKDRPEEERTALATKAVQLPILGALLVKNPDSDLPASLHNLIKFLLEQVRSHSDLGTYDLPPSERLEVLESLTENYGASLDAMQGIKALNASDIDPSYFDRLFKLIEQLYDEASKTLSAELKPAPQPRKRPQKRTKTASGHPQKKVIKTRKGGVLIGDLKPAGTSLPIEVVELRSEVDDELLATYSQHDDVWDIVEVQRPVPPPPRTRAIKTIKSDARKLLDQLDNSLLSAERYKSQCRFPQEIEEIMNNEASRYRKRCEELERAITASTKPRTPADQALIDELSNAASRLATRGSALRTELSFKLPPTDSNLRYLFEKNLIQVARLGERKALKSERKDFLQEYAINDRDGWPLWYAHFHYEAADTPKADFSVAHLKTKEQRREHYHSMLAKAKSPYAVVNVHRGQIGRPLAQSKFLPLAP
ncbi:MAG: dermonecrotic toxin domain-containing protein [Pseudomonas rhizophila]|uniref:dermonecrotic toxin domain-containing protein n=1 Tax=Pseudomonas rhizophila TaxID=2045200 RepID=UPI003F6D87A0